MTLDDTLLLTKLRNFGITNAVIGFLTFGATTYLSLFQKPEAPSAAVATVVYIGTALVVLSSVFAILMIGPLLVPRMTMKRRTEPRSGAAEPSAGLIWVAIADSGIFLVLASVLTGMLATGALSQSPLHWSMVGLLFVLPVFVVLRVMLPLLRGNAR